MRSEDEIVREVLAAVYGWCEPTYDSTGGNAPAPLTDEDLIANDKVEQAIRLAIRKGREE